MPAQPAPELITVSPEPTDEELAVIVAAFDQLWPAVVEQPTREPPSTAWRFSGRWWAGGVGQRGSGARW